MNACAIILAAGNGRRMACGRNKVLLKLEDQSAVIRCLRTFLASQLYRDIIVACRPQDRREIERKVAAHLPGARIVFCDGGSERQDSVRQALALVPPDADIISVHDAARCFVTVPVLQDSVRSAREFGSGVAAIPMTDTVKCVRDGVITQTLNRDELVQVQTPQSFRADLLREAHEKAARENVLATDDAALVERLGTSVHVSEGAPDNIKLTVRQDLREGTRILRSRDGAQPRIGTGFDVHAFCDGRPLILGGVTLDEERGLLGHSDADVLVHAAMDALLGAAGLPDIGVLFPPDDPAYEGISSLTLLEEVGARVRLQGFRIVNVDCTLILERPKVHPHIAAMRRNMAAALALGEAAVNIKATTTEKLGPLGRGDGAAAQAVCLLTGNGCYV